MTTYFLNPTLTSNGTGSDSSPLNTTVGLSLSAGDKVLGVGGTTLVEDVVAGVSGTATAKIEFGTYNIETSSQITDGSQKFKIVGASSHAFNLSTRSYWTLRGLHIVSELESMYAVNGLISASGGHYIDIINCEIEAPEYTGVRLKGAGDRILGTSIHNCGADGLYFDGVGLLIDYSKIYDIDKDQSVGDCVQISSAGDVGTILIKNSYLRSPENVKQVVIVQGGSGRLVMLGNDVAGGSACIYTNLVGSIIGYNLVHAGATRFLSAAANDILVIGNLVTGDGDEELIVLDGTITNLLIYCNTFDNSSRGIRSADSGSSFTAYNNIFKNLDQGVNYVSGVTATMNYNCYDPTVAVVGRVAGVDKDFAGMQTLSLEANGLNQDPLLDHSYHLKSTSPCIGTGVYIKNARHFGGMPMSISSPDIGAHRYLGARTIVTSRKLTRFGV